MGQSADRADLMTGPDMKAKHLTPENVGQLMRVKLPTGAVIEADLRTLDTRRSAVDDDLKAKAKHALNPDANLRIKVTFDGVGYTDYTYGISHYRHVDFALAPNAPVTILN